MVVLSPAPGRCRSSSPGAGSRSCWRSQHRGPRPPHGGHAHGRALARLLAPAPRPDPPDGRVPVRPVLVRGRRRDPRGTLRPTVPKGPGGAPLDATTLADATASVAPVFLLSRRTPIARSVAVAPGPRNALGVSGSAARSSRSTGWPAPRRARPACSRMMWTRVGKPGAPRSHSGATPPARDDRREIRIGGRQGRGRDGEGRRVERCAARTLRHRGSQRAPRVSPPASNEDRTNRNAAIGRIRRTRSRAW